MSLQETITQDLCQAIKTREKEKLNNLKVIVGEFQRQKNKVLTDGQVTAILKILIDKEKEKLEALNEKYSSYLHLLEIYMPEDISDETITEWIKSNIDFSKYKNKSQSIKEIKANYDGVVDGNRIKSILEKI